LARAGIFSFEFFPPKTPEGREKLRATRKQLAQLHPAFFSVTFGAGGSTREGTLDAVVEIQREGLPAAPHLSCIGSSRASIDAILADYRSHDIRHIVALRGDLPSGTFDAGEFRYASELVAYIRQSTSDRFSIEVAAYPEVHPQARSARDDLLHFKRKVDAGANSAITQYFFNADAYFQFVDDCTAHFGAHRAGDHADQQFQPARAILRRVRCRDPALDPHEDAELRQRHGVGEVVRARRGHPPVRPGPLARRPGIAFLHAQSSRSHLRHLAAPRAHLNGETVAVRRLVRDARQATVGGRRTNARGRVRA
jgi:Methylenetetrahydrofolate reductase